jgi:hypothetical protein
MSFQPLYMLSLDLIYVGYSWVDYVLIFSSSSCIRSLPASFVRFGGVPSIDIMVFAGGINLYV